MMVKSIVSRADTWLTVYRAPQVTVDSAAAFKNNSGAAGGWPYRSRETPDEVERFLLKHK